MAIPVIDSEVKFLKLLEGSFMKSDLQLAIMFLIHTYYTDTENLVMEFESHASIWHLKVSLCKQSDSCKINAAL